jgi:hypothetical protein
MSRFCRNSLLRVAMLTVSVVSLLAPVSHAQTNFFTDTGRPWPTDDYWKGNAVHPSTYDNPYAISLFSPQNGEDGARAWSQTKSMFIYGLGVFAVLAVMPEETTGWDKSSDIFSKWVNNVKSGPVWDRDNFSYNYLGHLYTGGIYYQVARKSGYRQWDSFFYSFLMSTFYWEYGIEAFAETPSIQDLVFTPLAGWVYGEWAYQTEMDIRDKDNKVAGSALLGSVSLFLLDPIDSIGRGLNRLARRPLVKAGYGYFSYSAVPLGTETDHQLYLNMRFPLGGSPYPVMREPKRIEHPGDPVDYSIVGFSGGAGHSVLDAKWGMENGDYSKVTLGVYFTPWLSSRLAYAWGHVQEKETGKSVQYENYSLDLQFYLNPAGKIRPYFTTGVGEQMWNKDRDDKYVQCNAGLGLHWKLHRKVALQADWINYYCPQRETYDQNISFGAVYRFGRGEHNEW